MKWERGIRLRFQFSYFWNYKLKSRRDILRLFNSHSKLQKFMSIWCAERNPSTIEKNTLQTTKENTPLFLSAWLSIEGRICLLSTEIPLLSLQTKTSGTARCPWVWRTQWAWWLEMEPAHGRNETRNSSYKDDRLDIHIWLCPLSKFHWSDSK